MESAAAASAATPASFVEKFRYRVVYPGGVQVRVSPAVEAEKTGVVLEFGETFEASKSSIMDGINFVKLSDGSGWVFQNLGNVEILELLEVVRVPIKAKKPPLRAVSETDFLPASPIATVHTHSDTEGSKSRKGVSGRDAKDQSSALNNYLERSNSKSAQAAKAQQKRWRDIKSRIADCKSFEEFCSISSTCDVLVVDAKSEKQKGLVGFIVAVTKHDFHNLDTTGLEASLWLFVNVGFKLSRIALDVIMEAANEKIEKIPADMRPRLLGALSDLGERTKAQRTELGKLVDLLPDDIKNFHQRWLLIKVTELCMAALFTG
jgi:hypothetical protein